MKRVLIMSLILACLVAGGLTKAADPKQPLLPPRSGQPSSRRGRAVNKRPLLAGVVEKHAATPRTPLATDEGTIQLTQDVVTAGEPTEALATDGPVVEDTAPEAISPGPVLIEDGAETMAPTSDGGVAYCGDGGGSGCCDVDGGCGDVYCDDAGSLRGGVFASWRGNCANLESFWRETHSGRRVWVEAQALGWLTRPSRYPPLATSSPAGTPQAQAGVLGQPNTSVLFGNQDLDDDVRFGGRINFGVWLIEGQFLALQADYFSLEEEFNNFSVASAGSPILARPFFNAQTQTQDASIIAADGVIDPRFGTASVNLDGAILIDTHARVQGGGVSLRKPSWVSFDNNYRVNWMAGYRWFNLEEGVSIQDIVLPQGGLFVPGSVIRTFDSFDTENEFNGGEIGLLMEYRHCMWSLDVLGRLAMGNMNHKVDVQGYGTVDDTVTISTVPDGLLALDTNIGRHTGNEFCLIPEVGAKVGLSPTENLRFTVGYTFMYVSSVVRADDQIDTTLNLSQSGGGTLVGPARPLVSLKDTDYYLHGINVGAELKF